MSEVARRYHIEGETQDAIARSLSMSRMKVNRLLRQALSEGVVEVRVRYHSSRTREIEEAFREAFGLRHLLVAPTVGAPERQRRAVATVVSAYLETNLREGLVLAVGMGRNVAEIARVQTQVRFDNLVFVAGSGGATEAGALGNADHICRALAERFGGRAETLYAPAFVPDAELRERLMSHDTVRRTLNLARSADLALVGVGDLGADSHMARMGWFSVDELQAVQAAGATGDLLGYDFYDDAGQPTGGNLSGRVVGLCREDLKRISTTIAIASEESKARAILGALRTGVIDVLATSLANCETVMRLARI
ncbi:sugar-binding transcriptional regulator [Palleronia sediminis]|uniref:Sugar-binding transcriptional regulator n=1 Tax=Palleronia sediminis TaxID=2547833 RepID=A0A4R6A803_9RHOB|nr:sugar-binding transcriptional regulator [Palleronia sediminis]